MTARGPADFEWEKAEAHLAEAMAQSPATMPMALVHSAYYAAFHCALAVLLLSDRWPPKKHSIVVQRFGLLVKDGAPALLQAGRQLRKLKELRIRADYETAVHISGAEAQAAIDMAREFLAACAGEFGFPRREVGADG